MRTKFLGILFVLACLVAAGVTPASGGLPAFVDHLKCYKLKYSDVNRWNGNAHSFDILTLVPVQIPPFAVEQGCRLVGKNPRPKEVCIPVDKIPRQPPQGTPLEFDYACYVMRCPPEPDIEVRFLNQFGDGNPIVKRKTQARRLCVPTVKSTGAE